MSKTSIMRFSWPDWRIWRSTKKIFGSVGQTDWSVHIYRVHFSDRLEIIRSLCNCEVQIDVDVLIGTVRAISRHGEPLYCGQGSITFDLPNPQNQSYDVTGYVTVHHDPNCTLSSGEEAFTQTEDGTDSSQLAKDLLGLVDNPDSYSDATLVCNTATLPVHRNILSARSPVFARMFKAQMQEGRSGVVDIVDMELGVLQAMLKYVYSGQTDPLTHSLAGDLLFAADKYQFEELKMMCVQHLKRNMSADNVFRCVVLGELHDKGLKAHAVKFIGEHKNFSELEKSEEWQSLMKERPSLALEVMTNVVKYVQNK